MKIADVTVGTEYAYLSHADRETDYTRLANPGVSRVLVTAIHPGGKVSLESWDRTSKTWKRFYSRPVAARGLIMRWDDAQPIFKEIRERRTADAKAARERLAREQVALRRLGQFLDLTATDPSVIGYDVKNSIALANGQEKDEKYGWALRHEPKVGFNVTVLTDLLVKAYTQGYEDAAWQRPTAAFTYEEA